MQLFLSNSLQFHERVLAFLFFLQDFFFFFSRYFLRFLSLLHSPLYIFFYSQTLSRHGFEKVSETKTMKLICMIPASKTRYSQLEPHGETKKEKKNQT